MGIDERNTENRLSNIDGRLDSIGDELKLQRYQQIGLMSAMILLAVMVYKVGKLMPV